MCFVRPQLFARLCKFANQLNGKEQQCAIYSGECETCVIILNTNGFKDFTNSDNLFQILRVIFTTKKFQHHAPNLPEV